MTIEEQIKECKFHEKNYKSFMEDFKEGSPAYLKCEKYAQNMAEEAERLSNLNQRPEGVV